MEDRKLAIELKGIKKQYQLGAIGGTTLRRELQSKWAKLRGKEDPNVRIGENTRLIGQKFWALNGIDLKVYQGERLGIIGSNGAGKSTMLKLLARVTAPTEGDIDIWGRVSSMLEVGTGFHGEMTGRENVYMNGAILGMTKAEIDEHMDAIIAFSKVGEFIDTPVKRYSSGMFVKLAFSVAAHLNSEILIMDEVLAVGDLAFQNKCLERMQQAADDEGKTILYVSHNMATIRRLCERCIVMNQGKIIYDGDVETAIAKYMEHGLGDNQVNIELADRALSKGGIDTGLRMERLILRDKVSSVFGNEEDMKLTLQVHVKRVIPDCLFRMVFLDSTDAPLGVSRSQMVHFDGPGDYELDIRIPLGQIAKGTFYVNIALCYPRDNGLEEVLDRVNRAFRFEVTGSPVWWPRVLGYLKLDDGKIEEIRHV